MGRWLDKVQRAAKDKEIIRLRVELGLTYWQIVEQCRTNKEYVNKVLKEAGLTKPKDRALKEDNNEG